MNPMTEYALSRRGMLAGVAALTAAGLAGCSGGEAVSSTAGSNEDTLAAAKSRGTVLFGTEGTWSPWTFHDEDDRLTGYDIEVARAIAAKLGTAAEFAEGE